jgi:hypothetical protein
MKPYDDCGICVTADWNDWRTAHARIGDLRDVHWHQPRRAPQQMLHAYVSCANIVGALSHPCEGTSAPHQIRVCVVRRHNVASVYAELARRASEALPPVRLRSLVA